MRQKVIHRERNRVLQKKVANGEREKRNIVSEKRGIQKIEKT